MVDVPLSFCMDIMAVCSCSGFVAEIYWAVWMQGAGGGKAHYIGVCVSIREMRNLIKQNTQYHISSPEQVAGWERVLWGVAAWAGQWARHFCVPHRCRCLAPPIPRTGGRWPGKELQAQTLSLHVGQFCQT